MTRRLPVLLLVAVLATAGTGALLIARERARTEPEVMPPAPSGLALLVVRTDGGSLPVVVGSTGYGTSGALVVPPAVLLVIPGQGESSVREALELPSRQAATAVGNLLGVSIEDHATIEADRLAAIADEVGGVRIGGDLVDGRGVSGALVEAFGGPAEEAVPVIVLNGSGVPGIGEAAAERLLPGGFRVAVSQNASDFDHPETLIVVGSPDDVGLGERVRDLLGVGSVSVSVGSGIAPVTVVIGKDFTG